jgi:uncharacterized Ntn-hydrolase superfamily protein
VKNLAETFERSTGSLADRLMAALKAGQAEKWLAKPQGTATPAFLEALKNFMYWENYDVRVRMDGKIDRVVLEDILKKRTHSKDSP